MQCDATVGSNQPKSRPRGRGACGASTAAFWFSIFVAPLLYSSPALGSGADIRTSAKGCVDHDGERLDELLAIEAGTIGAEPQYSFVPTFGVNAPAKRRLVRR